MKNRGLDTLRAFEMILWSKNEITPTDHRFMETFIRNTCNDDLSIGGKELRNIIETLLSFYDLKKIKRWFQVRLTSQLMSLEFKNYLTTSSITTRIIKVLGRA